MPQRPFQGGRKLCPSEGDRRIGDGRNPHRILPGRPRGVRVTPTGRVGSYRRPRGGVPAIPQPSRHMPHTNSRRPSADNVPRSIGSIIRDSSITQPIQRVPGIIIEMAVTLFFAREKMGKTTLLTWLMKQLAMGLEIFGLKSEPQPVLFASLEEGVHLIKMRAKQMRISPSAPIHIISDVSHKTKSPITVLEEAVIATGAKVVVIDSLTAYSLAHAARNSQDTSDMLYPLSKLAAKHCFAAVIVHHANKNSDEFRGHTSTGAAVDTIASISIVKGAASNVRRLRYSGRYGAGEVYIARDPQTGEYELVESDSVPTDVARGAVTDELLAQRLIEARKVEGGVTMDTLRKAGGVKGTRTDAMAKKLVSDGHLIQRKVRGGFRYFAAA
jgi:hypothetical protein